MKKIKLTEDQFNLFYQCLPEDQKFVPNPNPLNVNGLMYRGYVVNTIEGDIDLSAEKLTDINIDTVMRQRVNQKDNEDNYETIQMPKL